jgi:hypothetical protein
MKIHIDPLYRENLTIVEYDSINAAIVEFLDAAIGLYSIVPSKLSLLWVIGIDSDGDGVDCLSLRFEFPDRNPSRVDFPICNTRGITGASIFARFIRAMRYESQL